MKDKNLKEIVDQIVNPLKEIADVKQTILSFAINKLGEVIFEFQLANKNNKATCIGVFYEGKDIVYYNHFNSYYFNADRFEKICGYNNNLLTHTNHLIKSLRLLESYVKRNNLVGIDLQEYVD